MPVRSLIQLMARPEDYDDTPVLVSGYFVVEGDGGLNGLLYPTEEHARWDLDSCLGVSLEPCKETHGSDQQLEPSDVDEYEKTYIMLGGTFKATPRSVFPGIICGVTRVERKWRSPLFTVPAGSATAR